MLTLGNANKITVKLIETEHLWGRKNYSSYKNFRIKEASCFPKYIFDLDDFSYYKSSDYKSSDYIGSHYKSSDYKFELYRFVLQEFGL